MLTAGLGAFMAAAAFASFRHLLAQQVLPKAGEGPAKETRHVGYFKQLGAAGITFAVERA